MVIIVMQDTLIWQAGVEFGLQALAELQKKNVYFNCYLRSRGPHLEAIAYAVHQLNLESKTFFMHNINKYIKKAKIVVLPRVCALESESISNNLKSGRIVITSDPSIKSNEKKKLYTFPRRDWRALSNLLDSLWSI